jgi:hypothetical protein
MINRELWLRYVAQIEVLIEQDGMYNAFGAFLEALQNIEKERIDDQGDEFYESQEYRNLQHCQQIVDHVMTACDLDVEFGYGEARKVAMERFKDNIREYETPKLLKEQA